MSRALRRGVCPGLLQPLETGDGLLVRIAAGSAPERCESWLGLCAAARECGSGVVEVTARGGLQLRGLRREALAGFARRMSELGLAADAPPHVQSAPLAGLEPEEWLDTGPLAAELRAALRAAPGLAGLPPKTAIALDGGGALHLGGLPAELRLRAGPEGLLLFAGSDARGETGSVEGTVLARVAPERAAALLVRLVHELARQGRAEPLAHGEGLAALRAVLAGQGEPPAPLPARPPAEPLGEHALRGGLRALGVAPAFGQCESDALGALVEAAVALGARGLRPCPGRVLLVIGLAAADAPRLAERARRLGFVTAARDPRRHVVACPGAPACGSALAPARAAAAAVAAAAPELLDGSLVLHVSGCAKGCAHPRAAALGFVGTPAGLALVRDAPCASAPLGLLPAAELPARLARLSRRVAAEREPGERAAAVLARLGERGLTAALLGASA